MNKWKEVAKLFGLELEEEFKIEGLGEFKFRFTEHGLQYFCDRWRSALECTLVLLNGQHKVIKMSWKPKNDDTYWYWSISDNEVYITTFMDNCNGDLKNWKTGNCFKTEEEAKTKGKEIMEQIKKEYENA